MYKNDSLGNRMKGYEDCYRFYLTKRTPVIIRVDGRAFHTLTRGFARPFDRVFMNTMQETAKYLVKNIAGCELAYVQSDEISLLLIDYQTLNTEPWFDNNLQKLVSVAASMATLAFNKFLSDYVNSEKFWDCESVERENKKDWGVYSKALDKGATFDARAYTIPKEEVCNYFIWRQQDSVRNSIQALAKANFSDKELFKKSCNELQDMLMLQKSINWNDLPDDCKRGACVIYEAWEGGKALIVDNYIPIFTKDRQYIEGRVYPVEEEDSKNENKA